MVKILFMIIFGVLFLVFWCLYRKIDVNGALHRLYLYLCIYFGTIVTMILIGTYLGILVATVLVWLIIYFDFKTEKK